MVKHYFLIIFIRIEKLIQLKHQKKQKNERSIGTKPFKQTDILSTTYTISFKAVSQFQVVFKYPGYLYLDNYIQHSKPLMKIQLVMIRLYN